MAEILEEYLAAKENGTLSDRDRMLQSQTVIDINHTKEYEEMKLTGTSGHTRAYVKIQDGCNQFCSYCIIPYARGRVRSRREEDILTEVLHLVETGYQEIVLTGIHISSYGIDRGTPELLQLLEKLNRIEGLRRIRLGSLEPGIVTEEFAGKLSLFSKVCPHFHLSLQSGCDETLRRMNRRYTTGEYLKKVEILRRYFDRPAITTDVIVGFPGETEDEFKSTEAFLEKVHFYEMHIFKYSRRQGTRAAAMEDQVSDQVKAERSGRLMRLEQRMSQEYRQSFIGENVEVLYEEAKKIGETVYQIGHTVRYIKIGRKAQGDFRNRILSETLVGALQDDIMLVEEQKVSQNMKD